MVFPTTKVHLLSNVPLSLSNDHQRTFNTETDQTTYFLSKASHSYYDFTYQKEQDSIKVAGGLDELFDCNYVMFQNTDYGPKWFYGFITDKEYVNPHTTRVYFKLDVYQTWQFQIAWKPSFVVREHQNRWNGDGSPTINTIPEGLDYGSDYETVQIQQWTPYDDLFFLIIVCTQVMHGGSPETNIVTPMLNGSPQPLTYYIHPFRLDGTSPITRIDGTSIGINSLTDVLKNLYKQEKAVNNIVSLYVTEYPGFNVSYDGTSLELSSTNFDHVTVQDAETTMNLVYVKSLPAYSSKMIWMGSKYAGYSQVTESKLLMYPYTVTILTDLKGNQQILKNEYIQSPDMIMLANGSMGVSNKVAYRMGDYLVKEANVTDSPEVAIQGGIINNNPNDVPIITDMLSAYLQGNRNQIENQKNTILFNQATGIIGNAMNVNALGVAQSAGSGYLQMAGLMAKQQDIDNTPNQLNRMGGNTAFDYGNGLKGVYVIKKQITGEYRKKLTDFFKMFGVKINELKIPNLKTRESFNYVQTVNAMINGNIPHSYLNEIKEIFNSGVTLWHGDFVGDYGRANDEL